MFRSFFSALTRIFDTVGSTAQSAEKAIDTVNHYVGENHKASAMIITTNAKRRAAVHHVEIAEELAEDANLKAAFDKVSEDW